MADDGAGIPPPSLLCRVGTQTVALPACEIAEILRVPACTRVPNTPPSLLGVANLRGAVLPVVSLARLLHGGHAPVSTDLSARVVVTAGADPVGLLVDAVAELSRDGGAPAIELHALLARDFPARGRSGTRPATPAPAVAPAAIRPDLALVTLRLAGQEYAIPLADVAAVIRVPAALAVVPRMDGAMVGVTAVRGRSLPVASLRALLGLPAGAPGPAARILVLGGMPAGVLVDSVGGTLAVPADAVDPVPPVLLRRTGEARIRGICRLEGGQRLVCLLSAAHLFDAATGLDAHGQAHPAASPEPTAQVVVFRLGAERYGLPVAAVDRILPQPALTPVPGAPDFMAGLMNLRGRAVPVIDLSRRFAALPGRGRRVMVVTVDGVQAGFAVDAVTDVLPIPHSALRPAPPFGDAPPLFDRVAFGRGGAAILLVSAASLLQAAERDILATWSAAS